MGPNWSSPTFPSSTCQNFPGISIYFPRCPSILILTRTDYRTRRVTLLTVDENYKLTLNLLWRRSAWTIQLQEWQNIIFTARHNVQKLKTTRIVKAIIPYDIQIKMWTNMTNQTLQTWDFRELFMLPEESCNSIMSETQLNRPPWLTPGSCQISTDLQDRLQPFLGPKEKMHLGALSTLRPDLTTKTAL
jgi:hypothetical protein